MKNRRQRPFCRLDNAFLQYTPGSASAIVSCRRELERMYVYLIYIQIYLKMSEIFRS